MKIHVRTVERADKAGKEGGGSPRASNGLVGRFIRDSDFCPSRDLQRGSSAPRLYGSDQKKEEKKKKKKPDRWSDMIIHATLARRDTLRRTE